MDKPILYRKRIIPEETVKLDKDEILHMDEDHIVTRWNAIKPKKVLHHGCSCYFLKEGFKVSKFYRQDGSLIYWYCDIIEYTYDPKENTYVFTDLLADVLIFPDGRVEVIDVEAIADALADGKPLPVRDQTQTMTLKDRQVIAFEGEPTVHPFTISVRVKGADAGRLLKLTVRGGRNTGYVGINEEGKAYYKAPTLSADSVVCSRSVTDGDWHTITLTHYYAQRRTLLYVDHVSVEAPATTVLLIGVKVGDEDSAVERQLSELFFWRSALSPEEVAAHVQGKLLKSSLELYVPTGDELDNLAQSKNVVHLVDGNLSAVPSLPAQEASTASLYTIEGRRMDSARSLPRGIYVIDGRKLVRP